MRDAAEKMHRKRICQNSENVDFEIDSDGALIGTGSCESWPDAYPMNFEGIADEAGVITGTITTEIYIDTSGSTESHTFDLVGEVGQDGLWLSWDDAIEFDYWEMKVDGAAWAE